ATTLRELIARDPCARRKARLHLGRHQDHLGLDRAALDAVPAQGEIVRLALIGSRRVGALTRDASSSITPALEARIDAIARGMPRCGAATRPLPDLPRPAPALPLPPRGGGGRTPHAGGGLRGGGASLRV